MRKMPFLPYLRMHALNLGSPSDSESGETVDSVETIDDQDRSRDGGNDSKPERKGIALAASDVLNTRLSGR